MHDIFCYGFQLATFRACYNAPQADCADISSACLPILYRLGIIPTKTAAWHFGPIMPLTLDRAVSGGVLLKRRKAWPSATNQAGFSQTLMTPDAGNDFLATPAPRQTAASDIT